MRMKGRMFKTILLVALAATLCAQPLPSEQQRNQRIDRLKAITQHNPRDVGSWHDLADLLREAQRFDEAIEADTRAIDGHPRYAVAYYGRGRAYFEKRDLAPARADLTKAIELWQSRGGLEKYLTVERPPEALIDSYRTRGLAWAHESKWSEAIADVSVASQLDKDNPQHYYERAHLEDKAGRKNDAVSNFQRAALLYFDAGRRKNAEQCLARLRELGAEAQAREVEGRINAAKPKSDLPL